MNERRAKFTRVRQSLARLIRPGLGREIVDLSPTSGYALAGSRHHPDSMREEVMTISSPADITQLLADWRNGDRAALEQLTPMVYDDLRRLANRYLRGERHDHTLQGT